MNAWEYSRAIWGFYSNLFKSWHPWCVVCVQAHLQGSHICYKNVRAAPHLKRHTHERSSLQQSKKLQCLTEYCYWLHFDLSLCILYATFISNSVRTALIFCSQRMSRSATLPPRAVVRRNNQAPVRIEPSLWASYVYMHAMWLHW